MDSLILSVDHAWSDQASAWLLKGIGCSAVVVAIGGGLETWLDFVFEDQQFMAHRDVDGWRFFKADLCPVQVQERLVWRLAHSAHGGWRWWYLIKGFFVR
jgi:hypothetical protein